MQPHMTWAPTQSLCSVDLHHLISRSFHSDMIERCMCVDVVPDEPTERTNTFFGKFIPKFDRRFSILLSPKCLLLSAPLLPTHIKASVKQEKQTRFALKILSCCCSCILICCFHSPNFTHDSTIHLSLH